MTSNVFHSRISQESISQTKKSSHSKSWNATSNTHFIFTSLYRIRIFYTLSSHETTDTVPTTTTTTTTIIPTSNDIIFPSLHILFVSVAIGSISYWWMLYRLVVEYSILLSQQPKEHPRTSIETITAPPTAS